MILYLYGNDTVKIRSEVARIKEAFLKKDPDAMNLSEISADELNVPQLRQTVESVPFLANSRLVILHRLQQEASKDQLSAIHEWVSASALPEHSVIVVAEYDSPDKRGKLHKWLLKNARAKEFAATRVSVKDRCMRVAQEHGVNLSPQVLNELVARLGDDATKADQVLEQLTLYAVAQEHSDITLPMLDLFVEGEIDDEIFLLTDALARRDQSGALKRLQRQIDKGADPYYIHSMLVFQMRNLLLVKESLEEGLAKDAIAKRTGLHPYVVQKTMSVAGGFSLKQLMGLFQALVRMEKQFKTSSADPRVSVDLFVASVTK